MDVYFKIKEILSNARNKAYSSVNSIMVEAYWNIGRIIIEEEQEGKEKANYGENLIKILSKKLTLELGKGFNERNLRNMRQFYLLFMNWNAVRAELSWTHYRLLLKVETHNAIDYYLSECISSNWSTRELDRQINSMLYERVKMSKNNSKVRNIKTENKLEPKDIIKDPYVLEFLDLNENKSFLEKDLEQAIIDKLQKFLLELGKGFAFVERQKRISIDNEHYYVDLVFYNYVLKCFVLIDLKIGKLKPQDVGQIDFYTRYFEDKIKEKGDNPTIGIILCTDKNETVVKYSILNESKNIFASRYQMYLPSEKEFKDEILREKEFIENN